MKFDVESIYFGVAVQLNNRVYYSYVSIKNMNVKVWFEDGFFNIDDGGTVIGIVPANVKQFVRKKNEQTGVASTARLRSVKLDE